MPTFAYTARDSSGAAINGTLAGETIADISRQLRAEGKFPINVRPVEEAKRELASSGLRVARAEVISICTQLSIMVQTGVTLSEALECIAQQTVHPKVKRLVMDLSLQVQGGSDFSAALARHPRSFPRMLVSLVQASEKSGMLGEMLSRASTYLRDEQDTLRRVRGAMVYPAIMLGFAVNATSFLLVFVLPKLTAIYAAKSAALPLPTRILMATSSAIIDHWLALLSGLVTLVVAAWFYLRSASGACLWHYVQLRFPLLGSIFRKLHLARSLRLVGTMAGAGVNLLDAVETARELCSNTYFRELWDQVSEKIQLGRQLSEPMFDSPLVPRSIAQMMHSGEKSGKLAYVMERVATYTEAELKDTIASLTRYVEPAMIIGMGILIGGIALALLLPIFTISRVMAGN